MLSEHVSVFPPKSCVLIAVVPRADHVLTCICMQEISLCMPLSFVSNSAPCCGILTTSECESSWSQMANYLITMLYFHSLEKENHDTWFWFKCEVTMSKATQYAKYIVYMKCNNFEMGLISNFCVTSHKRSNNKKGSDKKK